MKNMKYNEDVTWLIIVYGGSTGFVAVQVMIINVATRVQNMSCMNGRNVMDRVLAVCVNGTVSKIIIDIAKARAPPSLLGIDRRIP